MTREQKLALIVGFVLILGTAILITDHFGPGGNRRLAELGGSPYPRGPEIALIQPQEDPRANGNQSPRDHELAADDSNQARPPDPPIFNLNENQSQTSGTGQAQTPPPVIRRHTVQPGESLTSVARLYYNDGNLWMALAEYNQDNVPDNLRLRKNGVLLIPPKAELEKLAGIEPDAGHSTAKPTYTKYTIRGDDTLSGIAKRYLKSANRWRVIYDANRDVLNSPDILPVGEKIRIPTSG